MKSGSQGSNSEIRFISAFGLFYIPFLRESILTDEEIAKYKTQWEKKAETAKGDLG